MSDLDNAPSRLISHQQALAEFGRFALQSEDLDAVLRTACEQVARGLGVPIAKIAATVSGTDAMLVRATFGVPEEVAVPGVTTVSGGTGSAMGYALQVRGPVISTVATETRFKPSEVVRKSGVQSSVNVVIWTGDEPFGVLEADSPEPDVFDQHDAQFLQLYANLVGAAVVRRELAARAEALARDRELLLKESVHRVKNILAVVQAIASLTAKHADSLAGFADLFQGRIAALSRLQDLSLLGGGRTVALTDLVRRAIEPSGARQGNQFVIQGPEVECAPQTAQAVSLLLYELTTNACKYGALSANAAPDARIVISWQADPTGHLVFRWCETGVIATGQNPNAGFGSELLEKAIPRMLDGAATMTMGDEGLLYEVRFVQEP